MTLGIDYKQFFVPLEDRVDIIERIDGEIIVGTNQLIQDLKEIQTELIDKTDILYLIEEIKKENQIDGNDLKLINKVLTNVRDLILLPNVFWLWLFKYIDTPLIPHSKDGLKIYQAYLKSLDEEKNKQLFNLDILCKEIRRFPEREIRYEEEKRIISFIEKMTKKIENSTSDKIWWFNIRHKVNQTFSNIHTSKNGKIHHPFPSNQKIFLVEKGDTKINPRNPALSRCHSKRVLFNDDVPLSKKLGEGDLVLGAIIKEINHLKVLIVNPVKKLSKDEAKSLLKEGIDVCPSRDRILEYLRER